MKKIFFLSYFFLLALNCIAQEPKINFGVQSGVHLTWTNIQDTELVKTDFFIGNSLGLVIRQPIGSFMFRWASLKNKITAYVDYGASYVYSGYNYSYNGFSGFKERYQAEFPILVSLRGHHNRLSLKKWRKNNIYAIVKNGVTFNLHKQRHIERTFEQDANNFLKETTEQKSKISYFYVTAFGIQKIYKHGAIMYVGLSYHTPLQFGNASTKGTLDVVNNGTNNQGLLFHDGRYFSIDCQYFIGNTKAQQKKRRKDNKIIYNPRYFGF